MDIKEGKHVLIKPGDKTTWGGDGNKLYDGADIELTESDIAALHNGMVVAINVHNEFVVTVRLQTEEELDKLRKRFEQDRRDVLIAQKRANDDFNRQLTQLTKDYCRDAERIKGKEAADADQAQT